MESSENSDWVFLNPDGSEGLNSSHGDFNRVWNWNHIETPSSGVGPISPVDGNGYIYTESSSAKDRDKFSMSTEVDGSDGNVTVSFWYSADTNNSEVQITLSAHNGSKWVKEFDKNVASDSPEWKEVEVDLTHYNNSDLKIKIVINLLRKGTTWHKDVGIDLIKIIGSDVAGETGMTTWLKEKGMTAVRNRGRRE